MYDNGESYFRLTDSTNQTGNNSETGYATARVSNIDKTEPEEANITLEKTRVELDNIPLQEQSLDYTESLESFENPERGFYRTAYAELKPSGNIAVNPTAKLTHLRVGIGNFSHAVNGKEDIELTADALNSLNETLDNAKRNGCSIIIRFAYDPNFGGRADCEPSMDMMIRHITQLKPIFEANQDVITYIEIGFFGPWGEMHTSSICQTENVNRVIDAVLDNTPEKMKIGVRTPGYYAGWLGIDRAELDKNVTEQGTRAYRVGLFNDGYLGSESDLGTYENREVEISWLEKQAMHTVFGGEVVANANPADIPAINTAAYMAQEAFRTHTTYLNAEWNGSVIETWKNETYNGDDTLYKGKTGYTYISNHLGYRFVLKKSEMPKVMEKDKTFRLNLDIENVGFSNLINEKVVSLVFVKDNEKYEIKTGIDATKWNSKEVTTVNLTGKLPENMSVGEWRVYLRISQYGDMNTDHNYKCIRLANNGTWNSSIEANYVGKFKIVEDDGTGKLTANITQSDNQSGVEIVKSKWVYTKNGTEIGTEESKYTGGTFTTNPEEIILRSRQAGTYYLHILTEDKAGNKKETISEPITVVK